MESYPTGNAGNNPTGNAAKRPSGKLTAKVAVIFLVIGFVLGIAGCYALMQDPPQWLSHDKGQGQAQAVGLSPTTVFSRIQDQGELVSVSQDYVIVDKVTEQNRDFLDLFDVPFTKNSFWYRYTGTIKAGVNMETARIKQDAGDPSVLHITLDQPEIISNTPDMDKSGVLEEHNNVLNPISISESDSFQKECQERSRQEAIDGGLLDDAKTEAERDLTNVFSAAFGEGTYTLDFTYRDAEQ